MCVRVNSSCLPTCYSMNSIQKLLVLSAIRPTGLIFPHVSRARFLRLLKFYIRVEKASQPSRIDLTRLELAAVMGALDFNEQFRFPSARKQLLAVRERDNGVIFTVNYQ